MAPAAAEVAAEAPLAGAASTARTTRRRQVSLSFLGGDRLCLRSHNECSLLGTLLQMLRCSP